MAVDSERPSQRSRCLRTKKGNLNTSAGFRSSVSLGKHPLLFSSLTFIDSPPPGPPTFPLLSISRHKSKLYHLSCSHNPLLFWSLPTDTASVPSWPNSLRDPQLVPSRPSWIATTSTIYLTHSSTAQQSNNIIPSY